MTGSELLERAAVRVFERKQAAIADAGEVGTFMKDAIEAAGMTREDYGRRLLVGFDLEPADMQAISAGYVEALSATLERSGELPPIGLLLGSAFSEGILLGVFFERERQRAEAAGALELAD